MMRITAALSVFLSFGILCSAASFTAKGNMQSTYRAVLNEVKHEGYTVESASPDAGIRTALTVKGHYHQTGSYLQIQFSSGENGTNVDVSVMEEKRFKALQTEPWGTPKVNGARSVAEAQAIKKGIGEE